MYIVDTRSEFSLQYFILKISAEITKRKHKSMFPISGIASCVKIKLSMNVRLCKHVDLKTFITDLSSAGSSVP